MPQRDHDPNADSDHEYERYRHEHSTPVPDDAIVTAVEEAYESDDVPCDALGGGVTPSAIHDHLDAQLSFSRLQSRLQELHETGALAMVQGADPETYRPRPSYQPPDDSS